MSNPARTYSNISPLQAHAFFVQATENGFAVQPEAEIDFRKFTHFSVEGHGLQLGITYNPVTLTAGVTILHKSLLDQALMPDALIFATIDSYVLPKGTHA